MSLFIVRGYIEGTLLYMGTWLYSVDVAILWGRGYIEGTLLYMGTCLY